MKATVDRATYRGSGAQVELYRRSDNQAYLEARVLTDKGEQVIVFTVNTKELQSALKMFS